MYEVIGTPAVAPPAKHVIRCSGLNDLGRACKKRLFDYTPPTRPLPADLDVGRVEAQCRRCGTMNHVRIVDLI